MIKLDYTYNQKKRASTLLSLALSEQEASELLVEHEHYREALVHIYYCAFYASQSVLVAQVKPNPSHKNLEAQLHRVYGKAPGFPRRYVDLHTHLHELRTQVATTHYNPPIRSSRNEEG